MYMAIKCLYSKPVNMWELCECNYRAWTYLLGSRHSIFAWLRGSSFTKMIACIWGWCCWECQDWTYLLFSRLSVSACQFHLLKYFYHDTGLATILKYSLYLLPSNLFNWFYVLLALCEIFGCVKHMYLC